MPQPRPHQLPPHTTPGRTSFCSMASTQHSVLARTTGCIVFGSLCGVLARMGLIELTSYDGAFLGGVIWANCCACFVMGMATQTAAVWRDVGAKGSLPLYVGITTGFCGTCSSFSLVMLEAFNKAANTLPQRYPYPNAAYGIMEAAAVLVAHMAVSGASFATGRHLGLAVDRWTVSAAAYRWMERTAHVAGAAMYVVAVVLIGTQKRGDWRLWTFLCLLTPWAAMVRYGVSRWLNPRRPRFPLGTFAVNVGGTVFLAVLTVLARGRRTLLRLPITTDVLSCHVVVGLDDGFCATVTTVLTFVAELYLLATGASYIYGGATVALGFSVVVLVLGSYAWAVGLAPAVC